MAAKKTTPKKKTISKPKVTAKKSQSKKLQFTYNQKYIKKGLLVLLLLALLYLFRGLFVAALVNGKPITRIKVIRELEKRQGKQVLEGLVTNQLIRQEADRRGIEATQDEINEQYKVIEDSIVAQGQSLDQVLEIQGLTQSDLREQIELQLLSEKMLESDLTITEEEIDQFVAANGDFLSGETDEEKRADAREQLRQSKLSTGFQTLLQNLQDGASIKYFVEY